ncbi:unnamed protein product [Sphagnum troendelagicum]
MRLLGLLATLFASSSAFTTSSISASHGTLGSRRILTGHGVTSTSAREHATSTSASCSVLTSQGALGSRSVSTRHATILTSATAHITSRPTSCSSSTSCSISISRNVSARHSTPVVETAAAHVTSRPTSSKALKKCTRTSSSNAVVNTMTPAATQSLGPLGSLVADELKGALTGDFQSIKLNNVSSNGLPGTSDGNGTNIGKDEEDFQPTRSTEPTSNPVLYPECREYTVYKIVTDSASQTHMNPEPAILCTLPAEPPRISTSVTTVTVKPSSTLSLTSATPMGISNQTLVDAVNQCWFPGENALKLLICLQTAKVPVSSQQSSQIAQCMQSQNAQSCINIIQGNNTISSPPNSRSSGGPINALTNNVLTIAYLLHMSLILFCGLILI